jgi:hypothetical protein
LCTISRYTNYKKEKEGSMGSVTKIVFGAPTAVTIGTYGTAKGSGTDLGYTKGGVAVEYPRDYYNVEVDQEQGDIDVKIVKRNCILRFAVAEAKLDNLRLGLDLPAAALSSEVLKIGTRDANYLALWLDTPGPDGGNRELWIPKCVIIGTGAHSYVKDGETVVDMEVKVIFDTAQTDGEELGKMTDTGVDTTPPTIALQTPADGGTVTKDTSDTVTWLITEADSVIDESTIVYGDTFQIINTTTPASASLVDGTIAYDAATKVVTFTPSSTWTASDTFQVTVSTGLRDLAGNNLATPKIEQFSVTA